MAFIEVNNVAIKGISVCVPKEIEEEISSPVFATRKEAENFIKTTGIERHRIAPKGVTASDMSMPAAEALLKELNWDKESVDCLIFVSQTPDYFLPATSCILQDRLGLSSECYSLDISLGCSGWVYGMSVISSLISGKRFKRGLLIFSDTVSRNNSTQDRTSWPLFGDAASVTAVEYSENCSNMYYHFGTDGSGYKAIYIPDGGYRSPFNESSFTYEEVEPGVFKNKTHGIMDGLAVFSFAMSKAPKSIKSLSEHFNLDYQSIDYLLLHQGNLLMDDTIVKKLKIDKSKVPYSLKNYGNTSGASIPVTIVDQIRDHITSKHLKLIGCGFGVGLSWGSIYFETDKICCPPIIEY